MKVKRTYLSGCTWCHATGFIKNDNPHPEVTSAIIIVYPVCNGAKTILVTEEYDALYEIDCSKLTPIIMKNGKSKTE